MRINWSRIPAAGVVVFVFKRRRPELVTFDTSKVDGDLSNDVIMRTLIYITAAALIYIRVFIVLIVRVCVCVCVCVCVYIYI